MKKNPNGGNRKDSCDNRIISADSIDKVIIAEVIPAINQFMRKAGITKNGKLKDY